MKYALIKNGELKNLIEADENFVERIRKDWDDIKPIDELSTSDFKENPFLPKPSQRTEGVPSKKDAILQKISDLPDSKEKEILADILELLNG